MGAALLSDPDKIEAVRTSSVLLVVLWSVWRLWSHCRLVPDPHQAGPGPQQTRHLQDQDPPLGE